MIDLKGVFEALSISANIAIEDRLEPGSNDLHLLGLMFRSSTSESADCPLEVDLLVIDPFLPCNCQNIINAYTNILEKDEIAGEVVPATAEVLFHLRKFVMGILFVTESWLRRQCLQPELRCAKFCLFSDTVYLQHIAEFLKCNKLRDKEANLSDFLRWYRGYIGTEDDDLWEFRDADEPTRQEFRQLLNHFLRSNKMRETLVEDLKEDPSMGGLIPVSAVWPITISDSSEIALGECCLSIRPPEEKFANNRRPGMFQTRR